MATPSEKLGASLAVLRRLQEGQRRVFRSRELTRVHRERLIRNGFLREVMKGWLISSSPEAAPGDTTPWFASFWEFCAAYCTARFGEEWHLSPEQSLLLHAENTVIPTQVVVYAPGGANNRVELLFGTSLFDLKRKEIPPEADLTRRGGLRLYAPEAALIRVPAAFFARNPIEARVALSGARDASGVLGRLLDVRPFHRRGPARRGLPPDRAGGSRRRDSHGDEARRLRREGVGSVSTGPDSGRAQPDGGTDRRPSAVTLGVHAGDGHRPVSRGSGAAGKLPGVSGSRRRHLSERRVSLAIDRAIVSRGI